MQDPYIPYSPDDKFIGDFLARLNRQIEADRVAVSARNHNKNQMARAAPALLASGVLSHEPETEPEFEQAGIALAGILIEEPLTKRYENYLSGSTGQHPNTEWWHAAGHQNMAVINFLLALTRAELDEPKNEVRKHDHPVIWDSRFFTPDPAQQKIDVGPSEASWEWAGRCLNAQTYLWRQDTLDAAVAAPLPEHIVQPNAMPYDDLFFSFEIAAWYESSVEATDQKDGHLIPAHSETWWCLITKLADAGVMFCFDKQLWPKAPYQPQTHLIMEPIAWGMKWPDDFRDRRFKHEIGAILRMLAFMQAPFVDATQSSRRLPRPIRKEYARANKPEPVKECSVITLRRALQEPTYRNGDAEGPGREYKHSWWVSGHYRWQYYPAEKTHRLIAIAPFIKQAGKPMLRKLYDVSR